MTSPAEPAVSVVIPTYNRADLLRLTLESLAAQRFPGGRLEVVVADDGSSDSTGEVARSVADRLPTRYYRQEDRGFRAASARNGGARLASAPVLVFLDTGVVVGPDFARAHYDAHGVGGGPARPGSAVIGYTYGYDPHYSYPGLGEMLADSGPEEVLDRLRDQVSFRDVRHAELAEAEFHLAGLLAPWTLCWSTNLSVHADDFWALGGFDEEFTGYGFEDVELGYRLTRHGARFAVSCDAWGVEAPHERDHESNLMPWRRNLRRLLDKHRGPALELYSAFLTYSLPWPMERAYRELNGWALQARGMDVHDELADAVAATARPARVAAFGCGGAVPASWPADGALVEFDGELLDLAAKERPDAPRVHALGIHTPFPDQSFDLVVISSRLAGLWEEWGEALLVEARRIGRDVRVPLIQLGC